MELRVFGCVMLAYFSVYALFWLFDNHDDLVHDDAPKSVKDYGVCLGASVCSYLMGLVGYIMRSFGAKNPELDKYPPIMQIWIFTAALAVVGFFFSSVQCEESFHMLFWINVAIFGVMIVAPLARLARRKVKP